LGCAAAFALSGKILAFRRKKRFFSAVATESWRPRFVCSKSFRHL
jgi:hypothetical protein